jgi:DNA invertase Pin-like site-specific DNA recombinase
MVRLTRPRSPRPAPASRANGAIDTATITKAGAGFKSLTDAWADTTTAHGRLMLTVLGGLAEFERELILARTGDGRKRAKARGATRPSRKWSVHRSSRG